MKITICGSIAFYGQMQEIDTFLQTAGHEVRLPPETVKGKDGEELAVVDYYQIRKAASDSDAWICVDMGKESGGDP